MKFTTFNDESVGKNKSISRIHGGKDIRFLYYILIGFFIIYVFYILSVLVSVTKFSRKQFCSVLHFKICYICK